MIKIQFILLFIIVLSAPVFAQGVLSGRVTDKETGEPLPGATVFIPDLKTGGATNEKGFYTIRNLPGSQLLVQVSYIGYKAVTASVDLGKVNKKDFELSESAIEAQEVVVSGNALSSDNSQSSLAITPITRNQLFTIPSTNLINSIASVPGVSEITTGGEISKPVIRGLSYNHIVTLNEGVRQEGSQWGDEHGIEVDQFSADRIEVLKGPSSLFYGSDAMGGVINILEPIPALMNTVNGELASQFSTNERLYGNSLMIQGNQDGFIWRIRGTYKSAAAFKTPTEYVYNSGFDEKNYSLMLGLNRKWGFSHLHFSAFGSDIGMIGGERDSISQHFVDYQGNLVTDKEASGRKLSVPFQNVSHYKLNDLSNFVFGKNQLRVSAGYQDNERKEFADSPDHPGLWFNLKTWTYDLRYTLHFDHTVEVSGGLAGMTQFNRNKGIEFLVPDYDLQDLGGFVYAKKTWERFTLNLGVRLDHRNITGKQLVIDSLGHPASYGKILFPSFTDDFMAFSGSLGMTFRLNKVLNFKFNIGRGFRAPNIAELGSNGIHEGTFRYEIGNPLLKPETSLQVDGEIAVNTKYLNAVFNGYYNMINNYIYYRNLNGETKTVNDKTYPVFRYIQGNSVLKGFEFELDIHPVEGLHLDNNVDYVWAENQSTGTPLPYIPALHTQHEIRWTFHPKKRNFIRNPYLEAGLEIHFRQNRVDAFETTTGGYFLLNASIGTDIKVGKQQWTLYIGGKNLTDTRYYDHLSRLKDLGIYNMGRNITAGVIIPFGIYEKR